MSAAVVTVCSRVGVMFDVRRLTVGDFLWVAREKNLPKPGQ